MSVPSSNANETSGYDTSSWEKLELTTSDPCRTTLVRESDGSEQYTVTTVDSGKNPTTTYIDGAGNVISLLEWHRFSSDKLNLNGTNLLPVKKWLKISKSLRPVKGSGTSKKVTFEVDARKYTWDGYQQPGDNPMELFADDAPDTVIAVFNPVPKPPALKQVSTQRAHLLISDAAQHIRNSVVLSLLLIEKDRRFGSKSLRSPYWDIQWVGAVIQAVF